MKTCPAVELPKQIKESLEKLDVFKRAFVNSFGIPSRLMKDDGHRMGGEIHQQVRDKDIENQNFGGSKKS